MPYLSTIVSWLSDKELVKTWGPICVGVFTVIGTFISTFIIQILLMRHQRKQFDHQNEYNLRQLVLLKSKEERDDTFKRLNTFYGPIKELNRQSKILYDKFRIVLKNENNVGGEQDFRTLKYLLNGGKLKNNSKELFDQIIEINLKVLHLIETSSGVVDKPELEDLLGRLGAHIRIINLAYKNKLNDHANEFDDVVFPKAVEGALESATLRLQDRLNELNRIIEGKPQKAKTKLKNSTIDYYNNNYETYAKSVFENKSIFQLYDRFLERIPRGGRILDAGCGVGQDTRYFIENGFLVISFDPSLEMYRICCEYPHAYCLNIGFDDIEFKEQFNGIWCCASLLHLTIDEAKKIIVKFATALKENGVLFLSLKVGNGQKIVDGRYFQYYDETSIVQLFKDEPRFELRNGDLWRNKSRNGSSEAEVDWLNLILTRKYYGKAVPTTKSGEHNEQQ